MAREVSRGPEAAAQENRPGPVRAGRCGGALSPRSAKLGAPASSRFTESTAGPSVCVPMPSAHVCPHLVRRTATGQKEEHTGRDSLSPVDAAGLCDSQVPRGPPVVGPCRAHRGRDRFPALGTPRGLVTSFGQGTTSVCDPHRRPVGLRFHEKKCSGKSLVRTAGSPRGSEPLAPGAAAASSELMRTLRIHLESSCHDPEAKLAQGHAARTWLDQGVSPSRSSHPPQCLLAQWTAPTSAQPPGKTPRREEWTEVGEDLTQDVLFSPPCTALENAEGRGPGIEQGCLSSGLWGPTTWQAEDTGGTAATECPVPVHGCFSASAHFP